MRKHRECRLAAGLISAFALLAPLSGLPAADDVPKTFTQLWAGVDPRQEPLETELLKEWERDGVVLRVVRYRIGVFKGQKAMMAAVYGFPKGGSKLPGLVQIHGGGQSASDNAVFTNAKRGYATISLAWAGRISAAGYPVSNENIALFWAGKTTDPAYRVTTDWGALDAYHAPCRNAKNSFGSLAPAPWTMDAVESPRNSPWFLCTLAARRALTFLEQQPEVDPGKLGVYGHSMGGKITVLTAAADARVKAAAPSCGGLSDNPENPLYRATISDRENLRHITCPIMFLSPANDFHGRINDLQQALEEIKSADWRVTCAAHHNHQDTAAYQGTGPLWFDQYLKGTFNYPTTPAVALALTTANGVPTFTVKPDASKPILAVDIYYTQQGQADGAKDDRENAIVRFWHHAAAQQHGNAWTAALPLLSTDKPLWVYANVLYPLEVPVTGAGYYYGNYTATQFNLSSRMMMAVPHQLKAAGVKVTDKPSLIIETFAENWQKEWFTYDLTDNWARKTHKLYDDKYRAPPVAKLAIEVRSEKPNKLVVGLDNYAAEVVLTGGAAWQSVVLSPADFHNAAGGTLPGWDGIAELRLGATEKLQAKEGGTEKKLELGANWQGAKPEFSKMRWLDDTKPSPRAVVASSLPRSGYFYACWLNGWRKSKTDKSAEIFAIETSQYEFTMNLADFGKAGFALDTPKPVGYAEALSVGTEHLYQLPAAEVIIELEEGGKIYRAVSCKAGTDRDVRRLSSARMWESGRFVQHYDFLNLNFQDAAGKRLGCKSTLDLVAWPNSLTVTATLAPDYIYQDGTSQGATGQGLCVSEKPLDIPHRAALDPEIMTVETYVMVPKQFAATSGWLLCKNNHEEAAGNFGFGIAQGRVKAMLNVVGGGGKNSHVINQQSSAFKLGAWNHLALTYDGATMAFYVNGKLQGTASIGKKRVPGTGKLRIGGRADGHGKPVTALFDDVRIWARVLTPKEISEHAAAPTVLASRDGLTFAETFDAEASAAKTAATPAWTNAKLLVQLKGEGLDCRGEKLVAGKWGVGEEKSVTVNFQVPQVASPAANIALQVASGTSQNFPVTFDGTKNCWVASVPQIKRVFNAGYEDLRNYDEFAITLDNQDAVEREVPLLLDFRAPANITGLCPMLCDTSGRPTGIPVQLSKNWHHGVYLMAYTSLPAKPGRNEYLLRIVYGFYGSLPAASHAQLSLIGYGGNGRWDQLAIGCWGETFCLDMDMSLVDIAITDVRMLMARRGLKGKKWGWTDAGWGGDWLGMTDASGGKMSFRDLKTAYLAHGPCLSDVRYNGFYGANREVAFTAQVQTLRTDDHARTFNHLRYIFNNDSPAQGVWFFKMGGTSEYVTPQIAYGNKDGLISLQQVPGSLKPRDLFVDRVTLAGAGPWWVAFPGAKHTNNRDWGTGCRALVIRSYKATFGGKEYVNPTITLSVNRVQQAGLDLDLLLVAPQDVTTFRAEDTVEFAAEWITLPRIADDYYGPNEAFRKHLTENPQSWKTVYREANGNDLAVSVRGGKALKRYPVVIQAEEPNVEVSIQGGIGFVPLCFTGLKAATGYALFEVVDGKEVKLDQAVHGNDFWQTDYDAGSGTYQLTYNLPVDGKPQSSWRLKRAEPSSR